MIAIITGASSGIGAEFARQLDHKGLDELWLIARRKDRLEELAQSLGTPCRILVCDLTIPDEVESIIGTALQEAKPVIRYLVNSAGLGKVGLFTELRREDMARTVNLNCRALIQVTHLAIPYIVPKGIIFNISSSASFAPLGGFAVYAASKSFVTSFSIALMAELKEEQIHSIAVCPGPVHTEFSKVCREHSTRNDSVFKKKASPVPVVALAICDGERKKILSVYGFKMRCMFILSKFIPLTLSAAVSLKKVLKTPQ